MTDFNKMVFVGLDGVPFSLLRNFFDLDIMPGLKKVAADGIFSPMDSSRPPISSVAWTSFMTGKDPGHHGIFGFTDIAKDAIRLTLPSFDDIRVPVIWNNFPEKRSVVVNLPFTYPARPLNGVLIAGFVAPIFERAVHPASLVPWLKSKGYRTDTDNVRARQNKRFLIEDLFSTLRALEEVVFTLAKEPWDIFIFVVTGTDRLNHFLFDALKNHTHPYHSESVFYYRKVDDFVSRFLARLDSKTRKVILSDHGFTDLKLQVNLNYLLRMRGYLGLNSMDARDISGVSPNSLAFAMDPTRIYINSKSRFRTGLLSDSQALETRARLKNDLIQFRISDLGPMASGLGANLNEPLFTEVKLKEEIYQGPCLEFAPDIVVTPRPGYDVKASINASSLCQKDIFTGVHTQDDAFVIVGDRETNEDFSKFNVSDISGLIPWKRGSVN
ncbi:MAG: alkaline phosphatase family protein [Desulfomonilaceae bacterium]|jgi:predicted AlkP superfamily phosphohydrolase/phosphomutase